MMKFSDILEDIVSGVIIMMMFVFVTIVFFIDKFVPEKKRDGLVVSGEEVKDEQSN